MIAATPESISCYLATEIQAQRKTLLGIKTLNDDVFRRFRGVIGCISTVKPSYKNVENQRHYREYIETFYCPESWHDVNPVKLAGSYNFRGLIGCNWNEMRLSNQNIRGLGRLDARISRKIFQPDHKNIPIPGTFLFA